MNLNAQVLITDSLIDITNYVMSIGRDWSLCSSIQTFDIVLDPTVLDFLGATELKPSLVCLIYEHGIKVLTGHINAVKFTRKPDPSISIQGSDNFKFVKDYFIDESLGTSNGETVAYWIDVLMNACGQSYTITSAEPFEKTVAPGVEFNLMSIEDALIQILAYSFSHAYCGRNGTITISNGAKDSTISFESGPTTTYDDTDPTVIAGGNVMKASHQVNDINTRNIIKVWGWKGTSRWLTAGENPYIQTVAYGEQELPVDKTLLYSSSMIQDYGTAQALADRIAEEVGNYDSIKTVECIGNPNISIAQKVTLNLDLESEILTGTAKITSIHSSMSGDGYIMQVKMDEFCPKFAAWSTVLEPSILYAGTVRHGVYKSLDLGATWAEYNNGLTLGNKRVSSMGTTDMDEVMAIINGQVWYTTTSGMTIPNPVWVRKYPLTSISGIEGQYLSHMRYVTVTSDGQTPNQFNVLTAATKVATLVSGFITYTLPESRTVVCSTTDAGHTWNHTVIHDEDDYDFYGTHMSSRFAVPYVVTTKLVQGIPCSIPIRVEKSLHRRAFLWQWYTPPNMFPNYYVTGEINPQRYGVLDFEIYTNLYNWNLYGGTLGSSQAPERVLGLPLYCIMDKPTGTYSLEPGMWQGPGLPPAGAVPSLISLQCFYEYSTYDNPEFTTLLLYDVEDMYGVWEFQNRASVLGLGNINQPSPVYDQSWGNIDVTKLCQEFILAKEYGADNYRLWGDGFRGSVGLCFEARYQIGNETDPGHPFLIDVLTGTNPSIWSSNWDCNFLAGTVFWEFD